MNKKGLIKETLGLIFCLILISALVYLLIIIVITEAKNFEEYQSFCEQRPNFCYCSYGECEFKTSWSSINGFSQDTKDLCELATKLEDKKILFKVGCNG